jgi:hypothetical protein
MSQAAALASQFYRDVAKNGRMWTIRDEGGFPAPLTSDGQRAQPFWSSLSRVQRIIKTVPAYAGFQPYELSWLEFRDRWIPGLKKDDVNVGVNWSGPRALGYDVKPEEALANVEYFLTAREHKKP